jgi:RNA polymerase sigma-70 factor (ECF subfamily)
MTLADLYEEYEGALMGFALRLSRDPHKADDLVQETFIRAMGHLELLGLLTNAQRRSWLHRTLKNLFLDEVRTREREEILVERLAWLAAGDQQLSKFEPLNDPFDLVPDRYRELFEKRFVLGLTSREIAEELGIPAATVRSRIYLAMKEIRALTSRFS